MENHWKNNLNDNICVFSDQPRSHCPTASCIDQSQHYHCDSGKWNSKQPNPGVVHSSQSWWDLLCISESGGDDRCLVRIHAVVSGLCCSLKRCLFMYVGDALTNSESSANDHHQADFLVCYRYIESYWSLLYSLPEHMITKCRSDMCFEFWKEY